MKMNLMLITAGFMLAFCGVAGAQDAQNKDAANKPKDAATEAAPAKPKASQAELESIFKASLTKAPLKGRWCPIKARIQYGKKDFVAPIPVQVKWAGDTPVIILDKVGVAGSGEFSARVMIYDKTYAGTWSGGDHGGLLNGVISIEKE